MLRFVSGRSRMSKLEIKDDLWALVEPLLPLHPRRLKGGRPRLSDRAALNGIVFVLRTGIGWEHLPQQLNYGSGMTCWRRLRDWQAGGVWDRLHRVLLAHLRSFDQIDLSRVSVDAASVAAPRGAIKPVRIPRTGAKPAANAISPSMRGARRSSSSSARPTRTTANTSKR